MKLRIPKKLIEVALPLDDINAACAHEKQPGIGAHPRGLHLWWARRPLAAARAVLFAQLVNDPGYERNLQRGVNKKEAQKIREEYFEVIRELVKWENINNEDVLTKAKAIIQESWEETCKLNVGVENSDILFNPIKPPAGYDLFAGGGAIPLEMRRLGLDTYASDLNPIPVLINKAMLEIPYYFSNHPAINSSDSELLTSEMDSWEYCRGIKKDIERYGEWIENKAKDQIGRFYPTIEITKEMTIDREDLSPYVGQKLQILTWIWCRTIKSPNPTFNNFDTPLISTCWLAKKKNKKNWVKLDVDSEYNLNFKVMNDGEPTLKETVNRSGASCIFSGAPIDFKYIREQGKLGAIGKRLMGIVVKGSRGKLYLSPTSEMEELACSIENEDLPNCPLPEKALGFRIQEYGMKSFTDLYTERQLLSLVTLTRLVKEVHSLIVEDYVKNYKNDPKQAQKYADAIVLILSFAVSRLADYNCSIATWKPSGEQVMQTFKRQAIPMTWDFPESNILGDSAICWSKAVKYASESLEKSSVASNSLGIAMQEDARTQKISEGKIISTDPPYYDNIAYADLSDFFYVWLRQSLKDFYPDEFATISVPKVEELVAAPYRHGGKDCAEEFFLQGMKDTLNNLAKSAHPGFPLTIYYAFKQSETNSEGTSSTGWETFLDAVISSGLSIVGTWPMRTESSNRMRSSGSNALASSIVLVCKKRNSDAKVVTRRQFVKELNAFLPQALEEMTMGGDNSPVAPVDLSQAIIGPGMAIFSGYHAVLEADGQSMKVNSALKLINRFISEDDFDVDTQFCLSWFDSIGFDEGKYGEADVLARAKGTTVDGLRDGGVALSSSGKFRLLSWKEYPKKWNPDADNRISHWELLHHLIKSLNESGEKQAGEILARTYQYSDIIRVLAYRLYTVCERKKWAEIASDYNNLILSWDSIEKVAHEEGIAGTQASLFNDGEGG